MIDGPVWSNLWHGATMGLAAFVGRAVFLSHRARVKNRRLWGWHLVWEIPVVAAGYYVGLAAAEYWNLGDATTRLIILIAAYLGPGGIEMLACRWLKARGQDADKI